MGKEVERWPGVWRRSLIGFCVLGVIQRTQPTHGYSVITEIRASLGTETTGGVLYPLLNKLETEGVLAAEWQPGAGGPGRKMYSLTSKGAEALTALRHDWTALAATVAGMTNNEKGRQL